MFSSGFAAGGMFSSGFAVGGMFGQALKLATRPWELARTQASGFSA